MAERYDLEAARAAYDATPAAATAIQFWHGVANKLARGVHGVEQRLARVEQWRAKVAKPRRCPACGERYTWHGFADGGRSQICHHCASQIAAAERVRVCVEREKPKRKRRSKATPESRARMAEAKRGTRATPAHRKNISSGVRRWWLDRKQKEAALPDPAAPTSAENPEP